jgi:hypothetical protein
MRMHLLNLSENTGFIETFSRSVVCIYTSIGTFVVYDLKSESKPVRSSSIKPDYIAQANFLD